MNLALWIVAGVLAAAFLAGGGAKLIMPREWWADMRFAGWTNDFSAGSIKAIGVLEILGATGLVLPAALDIAPVLVPLAAVGLVLLMAGAAIVHFRRHELTVIVGNLAYLALAGFVAWGRFGPEPFTG